MKRPEKHYTSEDARRFIMNGGEMKPTTELVERTRRILTICEALGLGFTQWNERLYPKLNDLLDCQVFTSVEEVFEVHISDAVYEQTDARTFGDLVLFYDEQITLILARRAHEKAKLVSANCATQTAFYLLRRRLYDAGLSYYQSHELTPNALDFHLTEKQAAKFVDSLRYELGLSLWFDRVIGNGVRTGDLVTAFSITTAIAVAIVLVLCTDMVCGSMMWGGFLGFIVWALCGVAFARVVNRYSRFRFYKLHREYQTLGAVARDFANAVQSPLRAQTALN